MTTMNFTAQMEPVYFEDFIDYQYSNNDDESLDAQSSRSAIDTLEAVDSVIPGVPVQQRCAESISTTSAPCCNNTSKRPNEGCKKLGSVQCERCFLVTVSGQMSYQG